ncbi:MAG: hypothetical protein JWP04_2805 [Belnapia sp.]|nr:hypothetical protein [Belnapia sp.]
MPDRGPQPRPDLLALVAMAIILLVLVGGYLIFPWLQQLVGYQDCVASGRITGC